MRPVPVFFRALKLLLPLAACVGETTDTFPNWSKPDELVHLFTSNEWRSFYLQIHPNGQVDGSPSQTVYIPGALMIKAVSASYVQISGAKSGLYLCMRRSGKLYGSLSFNNDNCVFKHMLLETHFDVYTSRKYNILVSLGKGKRPLLPNRDLPAFSQFLIRRNEIPLSQFYASGPEETWDYYFEPCVDPWTGSMREKA